MILILRDNYFSEKGYLKTIMVTINENDRDLVTKWHS